MPPSPHLPSEGQARDTLPAALADWLSSLSQGSAGGSLEEVMVFAFLISLEAPQPHPYLQLQLWHTPSHRSEN